MNAIYGSPLFIASGGGMTDNLPPLLDQFTVKVLENSNTEHFESTNETSVELSANKMEESRANELAGAVWVYGDHSPANVNDGTKIQLTREECILSEEQPAAFTSDKTINDLPSGSKVKIGRYNGKELKWIITRDTARKLFIVLSKDSISDIGAKQYDASEPLNPKHDIQVRGNNRYIWSNVHQWINSPGEANKWYTAQHEYDAPPDYQNQNGFLYEWKLEELSAILDSEWAARQPGWVSANGYDWYTSKFSIASYTNVPYLVNGSVAPEYNYPEEGTKFDNYEEFIISNHGLWFRSYYNKSSSFYYSIAAITNWSDGTRINIMDPIATRECLIIACPNPQIKISDETDADGYYTLKFVDTSIRRSIPWSNTKDFYARQFTYNSKKQYQTMLEGAVAKLTLVGVPKPVTELAETHSVQSITLTWKNPTDDELYDHTVVVYKTDAYPASIDDGTVAYSGTDQTTTISDLQLGTTYYISVFTVSISGIYGTPQTISVEIPAGQWLSSLASGTKVKLGKWNNTDLQWKVARDTSDQSLRLVLEPVSVALLGNMMYDNKEPQNSDASRKSYGNNRYIWSNIHQWLNATKATGWYTAQRSADASPDYISKAGFLSGWSENHIAALDRATLTTTRASVDGGGTETFTARVALMSTTELGLETDTGNGRLDIFNSNDDRATGSYCFSRTPYPSDSGGVRMVGAGGSLGGDGACVVHGVRPLCIPVSTALVSLEMDDDNCYMVQ